MKFSCYCPSIHKGYALNGNHTLLPWQSYSPTSFASLPIEIQAIIIRKSGPDIVKTLQSIESTSNEWKYIAKGLWEFFTKERFTEDQIETARHFLGKSASWRDIYKYYTAPPRYGRVTIYNDTNRDALVEIALKKPWYSPRSDREADYSLILNPLEAETIEVYFGGYPEFYILAILSRYNNLEPIECKLTDTYRPERSVYSIKEDIIGRGDCEGFYGWG